MSSLKWVKKKNELEINYTTVSAYHYCHSSLNRRDFSFWDSRRFLTAFRNFTKVFVKRILLCLTEWAGENPKKKILSGSTNSPVEREAPISDWVSTVLSLFEFSSFSFKFAINQWLWSSSQSNLQGNDSCSARILRVLNQLDHLRSTQCIKPTIEVRVQIRLFWPE